jgi:hypothetical protein
VHASLKNGKGEMKKNSKGTDFLLQLSVICCGQHVVSKSAVPLQCLSNQKLKLFAVFL